MSGVLWHDLECGAYTDDLAVWRELAAACPGAVLDVGCGTGRVTLDLARRGAEVVALDRDAELLQALRERAAELFVTTVRADAREFALDRRFALVIVPMATVQLLGGAAGRAAFLACARAHLDAGGVLACALAESLDSFDAEYDEPPLPDLRDVAGTVYASRPVAVRDGGDWVSIHRVREIVDSAGARTVSEDVVRLDRVDAAAFEREAAAAGFRPAGRRQVPQSEEYVGATVVVLRG